MRILTVCHDLQRGGTQRVAQTFSLEYHRRGHEVAVLAMDGGGIRQAILEDAGVPVFVGGTEQSELDAAIDAALAFEPEAVQFHRPGMTIPSESHVIERLAAPGRKIFETSHFGRSDDSPAARNFDAHLQLSEWCLWRWRRWVGQRADAPIGVVVNNPVDPNAFSPATPEAVDAYRRDVLGLPEGAFLCGRIGQAKESKWHDAVIHAFAEFAANEPAAWLAIIGTPEEAQPLIDGLPADIRRRVLLRPLIDNDAELACFYTAMDTFLHAARIGETFGLVLTEAMLCGTPPVTLATPHKDNSQPEVVRHGEAGLVALGPRHLGKALQKMHDDTQLRERLSAACRQSVIDRYAVGPTAERALRVMRAAIDSSSREDLRERLASDPELVTEVSEGRILELLTTGIGSPAAKERLLMNLVTQPAIYRLYQRLRG